MYIADIRISDVRGFGKDAVSLSLERANGRYAGWTVIAGRNGSGKSTFLRTIALAVVGPSASRTLVESFEGWVRQGAESGIVTCTLARDTRDGLTGRGRAFPHVAASLRWTQRAGPEPALTANLPNEERKRVERGPWADNPSGWLLAGYGPFRRVSGAAAEAQRLMVGPPRIASVVSLFREDASLYESVQWLREVYLRRLEQRAGFPELEKSVLRLLDDGLLPDGLTVDQMTSDGLLVRRGEIIIGLRDLSDGYRTVVALVLDIVQRIFLAHGEFKLRQDDSIICADYEGCILIDEVDAHLHVSWQQRIGFWLKSHFPKIQFLVTTHSPFVCQAADVNGLIRLPPPGSRDKARLVSESTYRQVVNGSLDEAVLSELFGLEQPYSEQTVRLRERVAELEAAVALDRASEKERSELIRLIDQLPSTTVSEVAGALGRLSRELCADSPAPH